MERPRHTVSAGALGVVLEIISLMALASAIILTLISYGALPEVVPSHFNPAGYPDAFAAQPTFWVLPLMSVLTYGFISVLGRYPHTFNYPVAITEANAKAQYANAVLMLKVLKTVILGQLSSLIFFQRQVALGFADRLPGWWLPVTTGCVLAVAVWFVIRSFQLR